MRQELSAGATGCRTPRCSGPGLALLASAAERDRSLDPGAGRWSEPSAYTADPGV